MTDERTGEIHDYTRKGGVVHEEIMAPDNTPEWMHDRAQLWNAVEAVEKRKDAQLAREIQLSLPHELTAEQRIELVRGFVAEQFVSRGMIADLAVHTPGKAGDDRNHHAHVMLTMRELTGEGFGKKVREWNAPDLLNAYRERWAHHQNRELERHGHAARVDHRSYEERGIDREPTHHLGPSAHQMEARGEFSRIANDNREILERNARLAEGHRVAAHLAMRIDREKERFEWWAGRRRDELGHAHELAELDLDQKHTRQRENLEGELRETYGDHKATVRAELEAINKRLEAGGVRRLFRNVFGRTHVDRSAHEEIGKTLASIEQRETERRGALATRQKNDLAQEAKRQDANRERLERRILSARERREREGWARDYHKPRHDPPRQAPQPTTNREQGQKAEAKKQLERAFRPTEPIPPAKPPQKSPQKPQESARPQAQPNPPQTVQGPQQPKNEDWRSTSTDHEPEDHSDFHKRWDRSVSLPSQDESANPFAGSDPGRWDRTANPFSDSAANPFARSSNDNSRGPSPSFGGSPSGKGGGSGNGGGNSGGSGGGSGGGST